MKRKVFLMVLAIMLMTAMVVPAMATVESYTSKTVSAGSSIMATGNTIAKETTTITMRFTNTRTYAQHNTNFLTSIRMRAYAGNSGSNIAAASSAISSGYNSYPTIKEGYRGVGNVFRLNLYNDGADVVTSTGSWTPN